MSNENDFEETSEGFKSLRAAYEKATKERDTLAAEVGTFRTEKRTQTVAEILKAKGVPENAASLYSGEDTSEDAVGKWVEQHPYLVQPGDGGGNSQQTSVNDANANAAQRVTDAAFAAPNSLQGDPTNGRILGDPTEIMHALKSLPYEELQKLGYMPADNPYAPRRA